MGGKGGSRPALTRARVTLSPLAVIITVAFVFLGLAWVQNSPCLEPLHNNSGLNWSNYRQYRYACYSDVVPLYTGEHLNESGAFPYSTSWVEEAGTKNAYTRYMEYPVLTGLWMWLNAQITHGYTSLQSSLTFLPRGPEVLVFFSSLAFFAALFWVFTIWCISRMSARRPWDALIAAASPLVIVHAFTNFDMLAIALATGAMLAWSRRRLTLAGILIGLGTAAKLYPVLLLLALLVLCVRAGKLRQWTDTALATVVTWVVVNAPIFFLFPHGWLEFERLNSTRGADPDSLYNVVHQFTSWGGFDGPLGPHQTPTKLNEFIAVALVFCLLAIAWIAISARRRPRFSQLAFLAVAVFLLTNKVWSPQYSLWLVPLAVLALPRWRWLLPWMLVDAWLWIPRMYFYLPETSGGWGQNPFLITVIVRDLAVALLCARVIYDIYRPAHDLVRRSGDDDPTGGILDGADDVLVLQGPRRRVLTGAPAS